MPQSVVLKGRVVHSHISDVDQDIVTYRTGIEFVELSDRVRSVIAEFMETLKPTGGEFSGPRTAGSEPAAACY